MLDMQGFSALWQIRLVSLWVFSGVFSLLWTPVFVYLTYSKSNIQYAIQDAIADNRILYLDEKRSQARLPIVKGSNYPTVGRKADFKDNIHRFWKNVNWKKSGRKIFSAESTSEDLPEWKKRLEKYSEKSFSADDRCVSAHMKKSDYAKNLMPTASGFCVENQCFP